MSRIQVNVFVVFDDAYDRNIICITPDYSDAVAAFHAHNNELIAKGYKPNDECEIKQLIETHPLILRPNQFIQTEEH